ncbi:MAG: Fe-S cluster assembly ATPase SufC [Nitrospinae bacterium]|nr:Fe-S cluster assembly ATPase SufC [Nitrospinota bacterium]
MLEIKDLYAGIEGNEILKGISLSVNKGEIHAVMGPNGSGKSTLSNVLAGHPSYTVNKGTVVFEGDDLIALPPEERALKGLFLAYQYPVEIPGVGNAEFMRMAYNVKAKKEGREELDPLDFDELLSDKMEILGMDAKYKERAVNEGFSGGEKKKNEILQMALLEPKLTILDEIDSGLDIDALRIVAESIQKLGSDKNALIIITHFPRILKYIKPHYVHVISSGRIIKSGGIDLAMELESRGYDIIKEKN